MQRQIRNSNGEPLMLRGYQFFKEIGEGGYGEVWSAHSFEHDKLCAIKVIPKQDRSNGNGLSLEEVIQCELRGLSAGKGCPFIIDMLSYSKNRLHHLFVLEFVPGGDLFECGQSFQKRIWPAKHVKFYVAELAIALHHLHSKEVVYRDLKLDNILLTSTGHTKLTDFGFAQYISQLEPGMIVGTIETMSPEMMTLGKYGFETDWYSLGCVAFELLTGSFPSDIDSMYGPTHDKNRPSIRLPYGVDQVGQDFVNGLLRFDPSNRLASLEAVKAHPWMASLDWDSIEKGEAEAPFLPKIKERSFK